MTDASQHAFQVDLHGIVDLLALHRRDERSEITNVLVDVLRRSGQQARADELTRSLAS